MNKVAGWLVGLSVTVGLGALSLWLCHVPLPAVLELGLKFAPNHFTEGEPLVVTGRKDDGDFIYVKYLNATTVVFGFDRWGIGGPLSAPFKIQPGVRYSLRIESPSLVLVQGSTVSAPERVRLWFGGTAALEAPVPFELRTESRTYFAENPIGGTTCGPRFSGELLYGDGHALRGSVRQAFSVWERLCLWVRYAPWQALCVILAGIGAGRLTRWWTQARAAGRTRFLGWHLIGTHRWFLAAATPCVVLFGVVVTGGTGEWLHEESFGTFYDYQAASLLVGRLDVPGNALSGEAFVVEGKYYGYFGVTPALLRLPFTIFDVNFGQWSRCYLLGFYVLALAAAYAVLREAHRQIAPGGAPPRPWVVVLFTLHAGLGTTFFFLASRAYIYHEATLCGAAFALLAVYGTLRYLAEPDRGWWVAAWVAGLLSIHARPSVGLFALALPACATLAIALREWPQPRWRRHLGIALLCVAGVLSFNGLSYAKFGTFDGAPLRYHVQYANDPVRLARLHGSNFHLVNWRYNFGAYAWSPDFRIQRTFPYFIVTLRPPQKTKLTTVIDMAEHTLALPYAMPGFFLLATGVSLWALFRVPASRRPIFVLTLAAAPLAVVMLTAAAVSHRYTTDFCPALLALAATALAATELAPARARRLVLGGFAALTVGAILVTLAVTLRYQGELVWGVPPQVKQNYQALRDAADRWLGSSTP